MRSWLECSVYLHSINRLLVSTERERERETDRQTDRQRDRQTEIKGKRDLKIDVIYFKLSCESEVKLELTEMVLLILICLHNRQTESQ